MMLQVHREGMRDNYDKNDTLSMHAAVRAWLRFLPELTLFAAFS